MLRPEPLPMPWSSILGDHDDRALIQFHQPGGDDADHALVPSGVNSAHSRCCILLGLRPFADHLSGFSQHLVLDALALPVEAVELAGEFLRLD